MSINALRRIRHRLRRIQANPIYQRESGSWGEPNPYYANLSRFSPFILIGALILGLCVGNSSAQTLAEINPTLGGLWCLYCLPNFVTQAALWTGNILTPALTAPAIRLEIDLGTWDILRLLPFSTQEIVWAKIFGALARLRNLWRVLAFSTGVQGLTTLIGLLVSPEIWYVWILSATALALRPWAEIGFHALLGTAVSFFAANGRTALAITYALLFGLKIVSYIATVVLTVLLGGITAADSTGQLGLFFFLTPLLFYGVLLGMATAVINRKTRTEMVGLPWA